MLKDKFFLASYGANALGIAIGTALGSAVFKLPPETLIPAAIGMVVAYPVAYMQGRNNLLKQQASDPAPKLTN